RRVPPRRCERGARGASHGGAVRPPRVPPPRGRGRSRAVAAPLPLVLHRRAGPAAGRGVGGARAPPGHPGGAVAAAVQAPPRPRPRLAEPRAFLAAAAANEFVAGVVGWVALSAPDVADRLAALRAGAGGTKLVGIRHQVHDEADPEWLLRRDVQRGIAAVGEAGLAYGSLVRTRDPPAPPATA